MERPQESRQRLRIVVNGREVLRVKQPTPEFTEPPPVYFGENPLLGGSLVGARFSGTILSTGRRPMEDATSPSTP